MNDNQTDRHTDSPMIGIMTERERIGPREREQDIETARKIVRKTP